MAKKAVYEHLKLQNRPYNANDIVSNLDKKFPKTAIQKALDELVESGSVMEKVSLWWKNVFSIKLKFSLFSEKNWN